MHGAGALEKLQHEKARAIEIREDGDRTRGLGVWEVGRELREFRASVALNDSTLTTWRL